MKPDLKANKLALESEAKVNAETRRRINDYLSRTGLGTRDFAHRIGYGDSTLRHFLADTYQVVGRSAHLIRDAAERFMEQHPIAPLTRVNGELYETSNVRVIRETFEKLLPKPVAYMIYAPPGSQKSFVLEHEVARLNVQELSKNGTGRRAFYVYGRQNIRPLDMVKRVARACGCRIASNIDLMLDNIRFEYQNRRVLLIVDEAQHLSIECFEILRELLDQPPYFSLLFAGSHDLKITFDRFSATLEQWNSRIIDKVLLPGLELKEAEGIVWREIGDVLRPLGNKADALVAELIKRSTTKDAFERGRHYINVRTLTNALDQVKANTRGAA